jgi:hypothetical protein
MFERTAAAVFEPCTAYQAFKRSCFMHASCVCLCRAADVISAVEFDSDGSYLATGDKGGRVVLFEKVSTQPVSNRSFGNQIQLQQRLMVARLAAAAAIVDFASAAAVALHCLSY